MPLLITPYTLGAQLPAAPAGTVFGVGYYLRRKRFMAYMLTSIVLMLVLR